MRIPGPLEMKTYLLAVFLIIGGAPLWGAEDHGGSTSEVSERPEAASQTDVTSNSGCIGPTMDSQTGGPKTIEEKVLHKLALIQWDLDQIPELSGRKGGMELASARLSKARDLLEVLAPEVWKLADAQQLAAMQEYEDLSHRLSWLVRGLERGSLEAQSKLVNGLGSGVLSGTVTAFADGTPLDLARIRLYRLSVELGGEWQYQSGVYSDSDGRYSFSDLEAGTYRLKASEFGGEYLSLIYPDVVCTGDACDIVEGESIVLDGISEVSGVDFALRRGSSISGRVREQGAPISVASAKVSIFDASGTFLKFDFTDAAGRYSLAGLVDGDYRLQVTHSAYPDELWQDVQCNGDCDVTTGDLLNLGSEQNLDEIDFDLQAKGRISGRITNELTGMPISWARAKVYDAQGVEVAIGSSDSNGEFLIGGLQKGTYYAVASRFRYDDEAWEDLVCESCDPTAGTPILVQTGATTTGIDFALQPHGRIAGSIRSGTDGSSLSAWVGVYDENRQLVGQWLTCDDGGATFLFYLPSGTYFIAAGELDDFYAEVWDGHLCLKGWCDILNGDPVEVPAGGLVDGIHFTLTERESISGWVVDSSNGVPLTSAVVSLYYRGEQIAETSPNSSGRYRFSNLEPRTYYVKAEHPGYRPELYDDIPWNPGDDPRKGTAIEVGVSEQVEGIDFELDRRGRIFGSITDSATGMPIVQASTVALFDDQGEPFRQIEAEGYYSLGDLLPGTYFMTVKAPDYVGSLWQSIDCMPGNCYRWDIIEGTPLVITEGAEIEANVALDFGGSIHGTVLDGDSNPQTSTVIVMNQAGRWVDAVYGVDGSWQVSGLAEGNYFVRADPDSWRWMDELWEGIPCDWDLVECSIESGTPVSVTRGAATLGIDFTLDVVSHISGRVTQRDTGAPIPWVWVEAYNYMGAQVRRAKTNAEGYYELEGLGAGDFYVATRDNSYYIDEVYGGDVCESACFPIGGERLTLVLLEQHLENLDFALDRARAVRGTVTSLSTGEPIAGAAIDFWRADGSLETTLLTGPDGSYDFENLTSADAFYISTDNGLGFENQVWSGIQCPDGPAHAGLCDVVGLGTLVGVGEEDPITDVSFSLANEDVLFRSGFENGLAGWTVFP